MTMLSPETIVALKARANAHALGLFAAINDGFTPEQAYDELQALQEGDNPQSFTLSVDHDSMSFDALYNQVDTEAFSIYEMLVDVYKMGAEGQPKTPPASSSQPLQSMITFLRDGGNEMALLQVGHTEESTPEELVNHLGAALGAWVDQTVKGKAVWEESCEDFNIGDLACRGIPEHVRASLEQQGIAIIDLETMSANSIFAFDKVLPLVSTP